MKELGNYRHVYIIISFISFISVFPIFNVDSQEPIEGKYFQILPQNTTSNASQNRIESIDTQSSFNGKGAIDALDDASYGVRPHVQDELSRREGTTIKTANIITVGLSGADYSSIQAAINAAKSGDTIEVLSGNYYEDLSVNKSIVLRGLTKKSGMPVINAKYIPENEFQTDNLVISADNVTLEGLAIENSRSIYISSRNNTIKNNLMEGSGKSAHDEFLINGDNNSIIGNVIKNLTLDLGVYTENNLVQDNIISNNSLGARIDGTNNIFKGNEFINNILNIRIIRYKDNFIYSTNLVNNKPIIFLINKSNVIIDSDNEISAIYCYNCTDITIKNRRFRNSSAEIYLYKTDDSKIMGNSFGAGGIISLEQSKNNSIINNTISRNFSGIYIISSDGNRVINNSLQNASEGIFILDSNKNIITNNIVVGIRYLSNYNYENNEYEGIFATKGIGIALVQSSDNNISKNILSNNDNGLIIESSDNNKVTNNSILINSLGVFIGSAYGLEASQGNFILSNNISYNEKYDIAVHYEKSKNDILMNNIAEKTVAVGDQDMENYHSIFYFVQFEPIPIHWVSFKSTPPGAAIWMNGINTTKVTPQSFPFEGSDNYSIELRLNGYELYKDEISIPNTDEINSKLEEKL